MMLFAGIATDVLGLDQLRRRFAEDGKRARHRRRIYSVNIINHDATPYLPGQAPQAKLHDLLLFLLYYRTKRFRISLTVETGQP